jgi:hypothetical protein
MLKITILNIIKLQILAGVFLLQKTIVGITVAFKRPSVHS